MNRANPEGVNPDEAVAEITSGMKVFAFAETRHVVPAPDPR
jgi:hypothetical protein